MFNPIVMSLVVFQVILTGAFGGWAIRQRLRAHHLTDETKSLVSVSMAVVATFQRWFWGCSSQTPTPHSLRSAAR